MDKKELDKKVEETIVELRKLAKELGVSLHDLKTFKKFTEKYPDFFSKNQDIVDDIFSIYFREDTVCASVLIGDSKSCAYKKNKSDDWEYFTKNIEFPNSQKEFEDIIQKAFKDGLSAGRNGN